MFIGREKDLQFLERAAKFAALIFTTPTYGKENTLFVSILIDYFILCYVY